MTPADDTTRDLANLLQQRRYRELSDRIGRLAREQPAALGSSRISLAHLLALGADWEAVQAMLPRDTNALETSGWLNSLANRKPIDRQGNPIPWFTYPAIDFLTQILRPGWRVFEWGAGNSTLWWAGRVQSVVAVEDNRRWYDVVQKTMPANATLLWRGDEAAYVGALAEQTGCFDLIVIDGSHRNLCVREVASRIADTGLIVFDNSDMAKHREGVEYLEQIGWRRLDFYGPIPSFFYKNCTSVFFRDSATLAPASWPGGIASCVGPTCDQALRAIAASSSP